MEVPAAASTARKLPGQRRIVAVSCLTFALFRYVGGRYYSDPGAFANGFKGVCSVFVTAAFSFAGTELVGLAATDHPVCCVQGEVLLNRG